eukprot:70751_1
MTLATLRAQQAAVFKRSLNKILQTAHFKSSNITKKYDVIQINESYRDQLLDASCYAESMNGNNPEAILFHITFNDLYASWKSRIDHFIKTGLYILLINKKTNKIAGGIGFIDICDFELKPKFTKQQYPLNMEDIGMKMFVYRYTHIYNYHSNTHRQRNRLRN